MNMNGKHNLMYPEITVGDTVRIYQHNQLFEKRHVSKWTSETYTITFKSKSNGVVFYNTTARGRGFLRNDIFKNF